MVAATFPGFKKRLSKDTDGTYNTLQKLESDDWHIIKMSLASLRYVLLVSKFVISKLITL